MLSLGEVAKPARALAKRGPNCCSSDVKITTVISVVEKEVRNSDSKKHSAEKI